LLVATMAAATLGVAAWGQTRKPPMTVTPRIVYAKDLKEQLSPPPRSPWLSERPTHDASGLRLEPGEAEEIAFWILSLWDEQPEELRELLGQAPIEPFVDKKWFYSVGTARRRSEAWHVPVLISTRGTFVQPITIEIAGQRGSLRAVVERGRARELGTLQSAFAFMRRYIDVPLVMPELPDARFLGVDVSLGFMRPPHADVTFDVGGRQLSIQYGDARFDGCGEANRELEIAGRPAIALVHDSWIDLLWPDTGIASGTDYGLSGEFSMETLVGWAEEMEAARQTLLRAKEHSSGC
jgi:hypothetical protein